MRAEGAHPGAPRPRRVAAVTQTCYNTAMTPAEELDHLRSTNAALHAEVTRLQALVAALEAQLAALQLPKEPPPFVKANKPAPDPATKPPRKKRDPRHNHGRPRATPTEVRTHAYDSCPTCAYPLTGSSIARRREVLDLPPPPPVTVIEYQVLKRYCPHCAQWCEPELNLDGLVVGHGRVSVRIMALVAWLRTVLRLPVRQIQTYLGSLHGLDLSVGEICALLATVAAEGEATAQQIQTELRASPSLHVDETSWREAGQNGYIWVLTNAAGVSYFHYDHSRAGAVARTLTGAHYAGTLCTDFYCGYNEHRCRHQRCWAHLLRDLAELEEKHGKVEGVGAWITAVRTLYREGVELDQRGPPPSASEREGKAAELRGRAHELGLRGVQNKGHPTHTLGQRLLRHEAELFEFVRQAGVEATNNRAERAIRPLAVARKISGGTRSDDGSTIRMRLQTLFSSWAGKGLDPLQACLDMLQAKTPLPSS
jgi:transposase